MYRTGKGKLKFYLIRDVIDVAAAFTAVVFFIKRSKDKNRHHHGMNDTFIFKSNKNSVYILLLKKCFIMKYYLQIIVA